HIGGEAAFLTFENAWREITLADSPVKPLAGSAADFKACAQPLDVFHHGAIQVRYAHFEAVRHGEFVRVHEQFIRKRGADFKKLKSTKLVGVLHLRQQRAPVLGQFMTLSLGKNVGPKKSIDGLCRRQRKNMLIARQPVLDSE